MEIVIEGWRGGSAFAKEARALPSEHLPHLSDAQKATARKMGMREEDYARMAYAGMRSQEQLKEKTERFARNLEREIDQLFPSWGIERIHLVVIEHEYRIDFSGPGGKATLRVPEELVDDYLEGGVAVAWREILDRVKTRLVTQVA
jgi:hypothetical protein